MTDATAAPETKPGAEDLFEIFYAPAGVFERRRGGEFGLPLIALAVVSAVLLIATKGLLAPVFEAEMNIGLAKAATKMTPEQLQAARSMGGTMSTIGVPITYLIAPFIMGFVAWLAAMVMGVKARYSVAVMIATFSWYPRLIEWIASAVQMVIMPNIEVTSRLSLSLGAGRFLDGSHPTLMTALLGRVDLFTIWATFLVGLGFMYAAGARKSQAVGIALICWVVGAIPPLIAVLRS